MEIDGEDKRQRTGRSQTPSRIEGFKDSKQKMAAEKLAMRASKVRNKQARKGEGDRVILNMKPKHLFTGTRGSGKTDRR